MCNISFAGLLNLHSNDIVHCDIKPQNILLHKASGGVIVAKIGDLGLCTYVENGRFQLIGHHTRGTPKFAAPESLKCLSVSIDFSRSTRRPLSSPTSNSQTPSLANSFHHTPSSLYSLPNLHLSPSQS